MDYATFLYDPIYETFGVPAVLTPNRQDAAGVVVTVIERTATTDASEEFDLGTLRPGAFVRRPELADAGITAAELDGGTLAFGGRSWRIEAHAPRAGPDGEASGEILTWVAADAEWRSRNPARPSISDDAALILASPNDINFAGAGVTVADDGDGTVTVTIPVGGAGSIAVSDEGAQILATPTDLNFAGTGVTVADDGDGTVTVIIPGGGGSAAAVSERARKCSPRRRTSTTRARGVSVADDGDGTVTVTIPGGGATGVSDEGTQVLAGPNDLNFAGAGVTVADDGDGTVTITIPGGSGSSAAVSDEGAQAAVLNGRFEEIPAAVEAVNAAFTEVVLDLRPLVGGPFETDYDIAISPLAVRRTLTL